MVRKIIIPSSQNNKVESTLEDISFIYLFLTFRTDCRMLRELTKPTISTHGQNKFFFFKAAYIAVIILWLLHISFSQFYANE